MLSGVVQDRVAATTLGRQLSVDFVTAAEFVRLVVIRAVTTCTIQETSQHTGNYQNRKCVIILALGDYVWW